MTATTSNANVHSPANNMNPHLLAAFAKMDVFASQHKSEEKRNMSKKIMIATANYKKNIVAAKWDSQRKDTKGLKNYSDGMTKRVNSEKITPIHVIRKELRNGNNRNANCTKGILIENSPVLQGINLFESKTEKINSMISAQARVQEVKIDQTTTEVVIETPKASKPALVASFASTIANAWKAEKEAKEAKVDNASKLAKEFKASKTEKTEKVLEVKDIFGIVLEESGQLAFDLSA